jgi:hypothetical protein
MAKKQLVPVLLAVFAIAAQDASAYVNFDDFQVNLLDHRLNAGDTLQVILRFKNPDRNRTVDADVEILMGNATIFRDEDYSIDFREGEDKTVTIASGDFPGSDLDADGYNKNLMKYGCGGYDITVRASSKDFKKDLEEKDTLAIGADDTPLSLEISPKNPTSDGETTVTVYDGKKELEDVNVKVTWLDDPKGDVTGKWDGEDEKATKQTGSKGGAKFNITQKFAKNACGRFQVDAYGDRYCLARKTFDAGMQKLHIKASPDRLMPGQAARICANGSDGVGIAKATVHLTGPEYTETSQTGSDGCLDMNPQKQGEYLVSAEKTCYETATMLIQVGDKPAADALRENGSLSSFVEDLFGGKAENGSRASGNGTIIDSAGATAKPVTDYLTRLVSNKDGAVTLVLCAALVIAIILLLKKK